MDLVSLFTKEKDIAGLEISDDLLRLVLLARNYERKGNVYIKELIEEPLGTGTIVGGIVQDSEKLTDSLKKLVAKSGEKIEYAIVSIPHLSLYSKVFSFPKAVGGDKLNEAMKVAVNFNLPVKPETVYIDWEEVHAEGKEVKNEIMLATVPKEIVNAYTKALDSAGITPIAYESNVFSIARTLDLDGAHATLVILKEKSRTGFIIFKASAIRFSKFISKPMAQGEIDLEVKKISSFYEAEQEPIAKIINSSEITIPKKFANHAKLSAGGENWLIALGAGMRGLLPRSEDKLISLMAVGTEEAYAKQERIVFIKLLGDIATLVAVIMAGSFLVVWMLVAFYIKANADKQVSLQYTPVSAADQQIEARALKLNSIMDILIQIDDMSPRFSVIVDELKARTTPGITILSLSVPNVDGRITLNGIAKARRDISTFRNSLAESALFADVESPPSNLDKRTNIPFSASFAIKDKSLLFKRAE